MEKTALATIKTEPANIKLTESNNPKISKELEPGKAITHTSVHVEFKVKTKPPHSKAKLPPINIAKEISLINARDNITILRILEAHLSATLKR